MCFFAQTSYVCGDWKWGNMMERCPRQHRIGETCGAKLVHPDHVDVRDNELCRTCQEIEVKRRRLQKLQENIGRWEPLGSQFGASLDKAKLERAQVIEKIKDLNARRTSVVFRGTGPNPDNGPPSPLTSSSGSSYTYSTTSTGYSTLAGQGGYGEGRSTNATTTSRPSTNRHSQTFSPYANR